MRFSLTFLSIITVFSFSIISCGEFIGFGDPPELDLGDILKVRLYLTTESLDKLYESVSETDFVPCIYQVKNRRYEALIRVRGFTSRIDPKKSFTLKYENNGQMIKYALETAYDSFVTNRLALYAYGLIGATGLPAPETVGTALFINDTYMGYYTRIECYSEEQLESHYYDNDGELFKANFIDANMGNHVPIQSLSEKKFPDNNNFTTLNTLILNAKNMDDESWLEWVDNYIDKDEFVKYQTIQGYMSIKDTQYLNFYVYNYGKVLLLPWDNEQSMNLEFDRYLNGNSFITSGILKDPYCRNQYAANLNTLFLTHIFLDEDNIEDDINNNLDIENPGNTTNIIDDLIKEANEIFDEVDRAIYYEPTNYFTYNDFLEEKQQILDFLYRRSYRIPASIY